LQKRRDIGVFVKTLLSFLVVLLSTAAEAKPDCSYNEYGLSKQNMVLAFDRTLNRFSETTAQLDEGQFNFNEFRDSSCAAVEVVNGHDVRCKSRTGYAVSVGYLLKVIGSYGDWEYHSVLWKNNMRIAWKYEELRGCMYGPAVY
jgi:hypothetical protein